mmetsp:Transcript_58799/g.134878  ORF Transcript_58799/g.134878 Transcript_58799/m.134878 type:complete len:102 (+) Transcript_58799:533-838(+)
MHSITPNTIHAHATHTASPRFPLQHKAAVQSRHSRAVRRAEMQSARRPCSHPTSTHICPTRSIHWCSTRISADGRRRCGEYGLKLNHTQVLAGDAAKQRAL